MSIDIEEIRKNYSGFSDEKIEQLAKYEAGKLEPDVIPILIDEIKRRGLDPALIKGAQAQTMELTESVIIEVKNKIANLTCPECGQKNTPLVGSIVRSVISIVVLTFSSKVPIITCRTCSDRLRKNALISTALVGWWGIPFGFFKTPMAIISTLNDNKKRDTISDEIITAFVINYIGEIVTNWDKEEELVDFLGHVNKQH